MNYSPGTRKTTDMILIQQVAPPKLLPIPSPTTPPIPPAPTPQPASQPMPPPRPANTPTTQPRLPPLTPPPTPAPPTPPAPPPQPVLQPMPKPQPSQPQPPQPPPAFTSRCARRRRQSCASPRSPACGTPARSTTRTPARHSGCSGWLLRWPSACGLRPSGSIGGVRCPARRAFPSASCYASHCAVLACRKPPSSLTCATKAIGTLITSSCWARRSTKAPPASCCAIALTRPPNTCAQTLTRRASSRAGRAQ